MSTITIDNIFPGSAAAILEKTPNGNQMIWSAHDIRASSVMVHVKPPVEGADYVIRVRKSRFMPFEMVTHLKQGSQYSVGVIQAVDAVYGSWAAAREFPGERRRGQLYERHEDVD